MPEESYNIQYELNSSDSAGNPMQVCFHGAGRVGFDSIAEAEAHKSILQDADKDLSRVVTYEIRPVLVASSWSDDFTVEMNEDVLDLVIDAAKKDPGAN